MTVSISSTTLEKFTTFGDLLRFLRRRIGITQTELASAVGYSHTQISRLEQNLRLPDIPTIEARFVSALDLEQEPKAVVRLLDLAASVRREDAPALGMCPYKGLNYFDEADADLFVGRETLTAKLVERVLSLTSNRSPHQTRFLAVVGASGSGKSSLVRAGVVSALRWHKASTDWQIHVFTPTAHPLESLASTLVPETDSVTAIATLMDDLAREPRSLQIFAKRKLDLENNIRLLLVIDQFEETFALCRSEEERASFIGNLLSAASEADGPVVVVITLRADFYAHCANYIHLREALAQNQEYIGAMNAEELQRAMEEPARRGRWEFEPGLIDLLLHDVGHEPGALPLLSHALLETWQRRRGRVITMSGYASSGGVRGAIAETAETVFSDQFTHEQRAIARRIFLRLTELGEETGAGDTRRRATFNELILKPEEATTTRVVLKALADARLITTTENAAEVAHEALIREWPTLHSWLEENRDGLRLHRQLTEAAQQWLGMEREPDMLYRGARLAQAREWASTNQDEMNDLEREFLNASFRWSEQEAAERETQRLRELEAAQKLAETEKARAEEQASSLKRLRRRGVFLIGALVVATVAAIFAAVFANNSQKQALISSVRELSSAANLNLEVDPERSILLAMEAVNKTYGQDRTVLPEAEDALHRAVQASHIELTLRGHTDEVWGAVFSPDGTQVATASADGTARIWDATTGKELLIVKSSGIVWHAMFSPDGKLLATAGQDGVAHIWDVRTRQKVLELVGHTADVFHIEFSPDGSLLATVSPDGTAKVWDAKTGKVLLTLSQGDDAVPYWVAFRPDGSRIAVANTRGSNEGWVSIWDVVTGEMLVALPDQNAFVNSVSFSPDGGRILTTSDDQTIRVWDANNGENLQTFFGQTINVANAVYSPDGTRLASVIGNGQVSVVDAATGRQLLRLAGHNSNIRTVAFSPDGMRIVTAGRDKTARIWSVGPSQEFLTLVNGPAILSQIGAKLAYSPDGTKLAVAYSDPTAKVWEVSTGKLLFSLSGHTDEVIFIAYSSDDSRIVTASRDGTAKVWDARTGKELLILEGHRNAVAGVAFSPDGSRLATASFDDTAKIWDAETGQEIRTLTGHTNWVGSIVFSYDGSRIATSSFDGTAMVWDSKTGKRLFTLTGHTDTVRQVVFNSNGTRLATAGLEGNAKVWDAQTGKNLLTLSTHTGQVLSVAFSLDGKTIATASGDRTAKLWDSLTGKELLTLHAPDGLTSVAFSPDGSQLAAASRDGTNRIYLLKIEDLVALAKQRVTRSLTTEECQQYLHVPNCPTEP
jgi:WD40 repeat protein/transcriptional regulator with XRE-family HTH domain